MRIEMTGIKPPKTSDATLAVRGKRAKLDHVTDDAPEALAAAVLQRA